MMSLSVPSTLVLNMQVSLEPTHVELLIWPHSKLRLRSQILD
jgi:hypothetical protein